MLSVLIDMHQCVAKQMWYHFTWQWTSKEQVFEDKNNPTKKTGSVAVFLMLRMEEAVLCLVLSDVQESWIIHTRKTKQAYWPSSMITIVQCVLLSIWRIIHLFYRHCNLPVPFFLIPASILCLSKRKSEWDGKGRKKKEKVAALVRIVFNGPGTQDHYGPCNGVAPLYDVGTSLLGSLGEGGGIGTAGVSFPVGAFSWRGEPRNDVTTSHDEVTSWLHCTGCQAH